MKTLILTLAFVLMAGSTWGATYTVCASGCDETQVEDVVDNEALAAGDIVQLLGDVAEADTCAWGAGDDGSGAGYVTLDLNGFTWSMAANAAIIDADDADYIKIIGPGKILSSGTEGSVIDADDVANWIIQDVVFERSGANAAGDSILDIGAATAHGPFLVERCMFYYSAGTEGGVIEVRDDTANFSLRNSILFQFNHGIVIDDTDGGDDENPQGVTIYNNTFYDVAGDGVFIAADADAAQVTVKNCVFSTVVGDGIDDVGDSTNGTFDYNCFYAIGESDIDGGASDSNKIVTDPKFFNTALDAEVGFRLRGGSPAINAGDDLSGTFTDDYNGYKRPTGSAYDIGAHEWVVIRWWRTFWRW